jgi:hypothetical protein
MLILLFQFYSSAICFTHSASLSGPTPGPIPNLSQPGFFHHHQLPSLALHLIPLLAQ